MLEEARFLRPVEAGYPERLMRVLGKRAPFGFWWQGNLSLLSSSCIGFCGSRKASDKGLETAVDCAAQFAKSGWTVVSGNASGVDLAAHKAALEAGGTTILVLPEGINHFRVKRELKACWDWRRVLVISQFEPDAAWKAYRAMTRNQVIIGLSHAVIVIEAGEKGGTMDTGLNSLRLNVPLFVALYENMPEQAPGNEILLGRGAYRLQKNRLTNRAHIEPILRLDSSDATGQLRFA